MPDVKKARAELRNSKAVNDNKDAVSSTPKAVDSQKNQTSDYINTANQTVRATSREQDKKRDYINVSYEAVESTSRKVSLDKRDDAMAKRMVEAETIAKQQDAKGYKGEDIAREYDKGFVRQVEKENADPTKGRIIDAEKYQNQKQRLNVDRQVVTRLLAAGHSLEKIRNVVMQRSPNTQGMNAEQQKQYVKQVIKQVEKSPNAQNYIKERQDLRRMHGLKNDNRLQTLEMCKRKQAISNARHKNPYDNITNEMKTDDRNVYRSNNYERAKLYRKESAHNRDVQLAKSHLNEKGTNIDRVSGILRKESPNVANHSYLKSQQQEYAKSIAGEAHKTMDIRHDPQNEKYVTSFCGSWRMSIVL